MFYDLRQNKLIGEAYEQSSDEKVKPKNIVVKTEQINKEIEKWISLGKKGALPPVRK
jgi:hypothetical protein